MTLKNLTLATLLLVVASLTSCSPQVNQVVYHYQSHPCTEANNPYYNKYECENWQVKHPKEYARYQAWEKSLSQPKQDSIPHLDHKGGFSGADNYYVRSSPN